ncbi:MAG: response regulator transcription factor, partial [Desulfosalsimonadaceae bacterium]
NRLMLEGLQNLLEAHDIEVVGTAADGLAALDLVRKRKPDLILMDIRMPRCDGLSATRLIKAEMPDAKIVILTTSIEDDDLFEAVKSGACGYLLKSMDSNELVEALHQASQGTPPFSPGLAAKLLDEFARLTRSAGSVPSKSASETDDKAFCGDLNPRQIEVLKLLADGLSYKEIGARLFLSPRTIKYHMAEIMNRLHLQNRAQVLAYAGRIGLAAKKPTE